MAVQNSSEGKRQREEIKQKTEREREKKRGKKATREVEKKDGLRGKRKDRGIVAGALFLWEDPMHNLENRAQV